MRAALAWAICLGPAAVGAAEFTHTGHGLKTADAPFRLTVISRVRGDGLYNLDLDRGPTPGGEIFYPVPEDPSAQTLWAGDYRLRTDFAAYSPGREIALMMRFDVGNVNIGGAPNGPSLAATSDAPVIGLRLRRLYAEVLTPLGLVSVGRGGAHWGTGMLVNSGDCGECDSGDAADRVAWIVPTLDHIFALAYDWAWTGPQTLHKDEGPLHLDPADAGLGLSFAALNWRPERAIRRRLRAGKNTVNYGLLVSYHRQETDVPAEYLPLALALQGQEKREMHRGLTAWATDGWARFASPFFRAQLEAALLQSTVDEPSLIPGTSYGVPLTARQWGLVLETSIGPWQGPYEIGIDAGYASGDAAYGFGAFPPILGAPTQRGDLDGPQANPPYDTSVNNFRFHSDYHVDRILFREIIGTVTDAMYLRPHGRWRFMRAGDGFLAAEVAGVLSYAVEPTSAPGQARPLGIEIDPSLRYGSSTFALGIHYAVLVPLGGLDNTAPEMAARPAQSIRAQLEVKFGSDTPNNTMATKTPFETRF